MPVPMRGNKLYSTVQERLEVAHGETAQPVGIQSIVTDALALTATVVVLRATVTFTDGRAFTGISEAQFDATSGADKTNPIEVAETSAVGRALAFAGYYGSADGIAGAEEVRQAQRRQQQHAPAAAVVGDLKKAQSTGDRDPARERAVDRYEQAWDALKERGVEPKWPRYPGNGLTTEQILAAAQKLEAAPTGGQG